MSYRKFKTGARITARSTTAEPGLYFSNQSDNHGLMSLTPAERLGAAKRPRPDPFAIPNVRPDLSSMVRRRNPSRLPLRGEK